MDIAFVRLESASVAEAYGMMHSEDVKFLKRFSMRILFVPDMNYMCSVDLLNTIRHACKLAVLGLEDLPSHRVVFLGPVDEVSSRFHRFEKTPRTGFAHDRL